MSKVPKTDKIVSPEPIIAPIFEKVSPSPSLAVPPNQFNRNSYGLIDNGKIAYIFNEDASINWKKMINPAFIVPNKKKTTETDITKLEDKDLIIKLGGTKELAFLRGFSSVSYEPLLVDRSHVAVKCRIIWNSNYETGSRETSFESIADANADNTDGVGTFYLTSIAENRAFVRCVRNFLRINIVAEEETADIKIPETKSENPTDPKSILNKMMTEKLLKFEDIKNILVELKIKDCETFVSLDDIPKINIFEVIEKIQS